MEAASVMILYSSYWMWSLLIGVLILLYGLFGENPKAGVVGIVIIFFGSYIVYNTIDAPNEAIEEAKAIAALEPIKDQLKAEKFLLKEMSQKDSYEAKGRLSGGFLLIAGAVYGEIQMAEKAKLMIVYKDDDTLIDNAVGVHRIMRLGFNEKMAIVTINASESPYFKYDNAHIFPRGNMFILESGEPVLYLPEGWQIIGAKEVFY